MNDRFDAWGALDRLRDAGPLVHCITNYVAMDVTANALLAIGASPAMVHANEEVEEFVSISSALVVNIGTLSPAWVQAMERAVDRAVARGTPWVLDPVGAGATSYRTRTARELAARKPSVVRGNASEILSLAGEVGGTRGVDSTRGAEEAAGVARELARGLGCVVAVTGAVDYVTDGRRMLAVEHGHPMMTRVTALGCALTGITGALLAVEGDPLLASAYALALFGLAGEMAASGAIGPGTLRVRLMDALHVLDTLSDKQIRIREV
ncbi:MAG TPA: hydroxyethylthiazole kinase [Longimicrobium sp.]|nr:hydroxyethylthiazole kinase [Longimicrobium sp.]